MKATFIELPVFEALRDDYFDDDSFKDFQNEMMKNPKAGPVIKGTGGLRKVRYADERRNKGKRGGLRVIYYWTTEDGQFWLFTVYDKDELDNLTPAQSKALKKVLDDEIEARSAKT